MKLQTLRQPVAALALVATTLGWGTAAGQQGNSTNRLPPVEVTGRSVAEPRGDVLRVCPGYQDTLRSTLSRQVWSVDMTSEMQVVFQLKGDQVHKVEAQGGPYEARQTVRQVVATLACINDGHPHQQYSFLIVFSPAHSRVAGPSPTAVWRRGEAIIASQN